MSTMGVSIREKADGGGWWLFVRHAGGRTSKFVRDKGVADELAIDLRRALAAGDLGLLQDTRTVPTFTSYAERYLATAEQTLKLSTAIEEYEVPAR